MHLSMKPLREALSKELSDPHCHLLLALLHAPLEIDAYLLNWYIQVYLSSIKEK